MAEVPWLKSTKLARLDHQFVWHPFTQMKDWLGQEPIVITRGSGPKLWDDQDREYLDANSSIWTNLHGHRHPRIDRALRKQLGKIAHSSALGLASEQASLLAARLSNLAGLPKVFFSDDGSTAVEAALKLSHQFWRRSGVSRPHFLSLEGAYHGDTVGAVSVGHIDLFHKQYAGLLFPASQVMAPYCYRCPFNRAVPERADARTYRKCRWECVAKVKQAFQSSKQSGTPVTAFVVEPSIQGAAGMIPQPSGWLRQVDEIVRENNAHLIADEVLTGFGRTGPVFACEHEAVQPAFLAVAKGLTGGYLPMAATLTTDQVFNAFLGEFAEFKTFFHGHSYTGNALGAAAAMASLDVLQSAASSRQRAALHESLRSAAADLWSLPQVGDIRQVGTIVGIELVRNWKTRRPFPLAERAGIRVCEAMARRGVLTRPIGNVVVIMPPYCTTRAQVRRIFSALAESIEEICTE